MQGLNMHYSSFAAVFQLNFFFNAILSVPEFERIVSTHLFCHQYGVRKKRSTRVQDGVRVAEGIVAAGLLLRADVGDVPAAGSDGPTSAPPTVAGFGRRAGGRSVPQIHLVTPGGGVGPNPSPCGSHNSFKVRTQPPSQGGGSGQGCICTCVWEGLKGWWGQLG